MPLPRWLARLNRVVTNRLHSPLVGRVPPFARITHRGRRSGRTYQAVILAFATPDGFLMALTYGSSADWVQNVLVSGEATLQHWRGETRLTHPVLLRGPEAVARLPFFVRPILRLIHVDEVLELVTVR